MIRPRQNINVDPQPRQCVSSKSLRPEFTAVIKKSGRWWIGWIEEVPGVNCRERTRKELLESLKTTLQQALEMNRQDARSTAGDDFVEVKIAV